MIFFFFNNNKKANNLFLICKSRRVLREKNLPQRISCTSRRRRKSTARCLFPQLSPVSRKLSDIVVKLSIFFKFSKIFKIFSTPMFNGVCTQLTFAYKRQNFVIITLKKKKINLRIRTRLLNFFALLCNNCKKYN